MNPYLAKLRARDQETRHPEEPSKPSKLIVPVVAHGITTAERGFEGFEGDRGRRSSDNERASGAVEQTLPDRFCRTFEDLESRCPDLVPNDRWQQAVQDSRCFFAQWGQPGRSARVNGRRPVRLGAPPGPAAPLLFAAIPLR